MDKEHAPDILRDVYSPLIDTEADRSDVTHDEAVRLPIGDMRRVLRRRYDENPAIQRVLLRVAGMSIGITTRDRVCSETGVAGPTGDASIGVSDRAMQPGGSTQYRLIRFRCITCSKRKVAVFFDERQIPSCHEHGPMALVR